MHSSRASSELLDHVNIQQVASPTFQIAERIRGMILEGDMTPGMKLPPTRKLADQLSVDPTAVHRALASLVKEGLLTRTPRVGTFVAEPPERLERLAFYHRPMGTGYLSGFEGAVLSEATQIGQQAGFVVEVFSDTRPKEVSAREPHPDLLREARARRVQAVISSNVSPGEVKWYNSLPIPQCTLSTPELPHTLNWNAEDTIRLGFQQLYARGCRKIAIITPARNRPDATATRYEMGTYHATVKILAELGLPINEDWIIGPSPLGRSVYEKDMAQFGYSAINALLDLPNRPDGLMVHPDVLAQGVLLGIARRGISVPQELKLALHINEEVPLFCPDPVDRIVRRAKDAASALIHYVQARLDHRTPTREPLKNHLVTY